MREHFLDRIFGEFQAYKASVLSATNAEIFAKSYEIDAVVNFYEILVEKAGALSAQALAVLLKQRNILMGFYEEWLKKDDSSYREMEAHITEEIEAITAGTVVIGVAAGGMTAAESQSSEQLAGKEK
ncbi:MAG: DUF3848 domain-containing protein [Clostridiales bacterium]|nr:DUF3848 domain-containing protein [Clostridiales bacterium]